jgi:hypothetical protein
MMKLQENYIPTKVFYTNKKTKDSFVRAITGKDAGQNSFSLMSLSSWQN